MRCLVMAPVGVPVAALNAVLGEQGLEPVFSSDLGAGALLATADLGDVVCAVAVLQQPRSSSTPSAVPGFSAILVEIGVTLGRRIPTLVLVDPDAPTIAALATVPKAAVSLEDQFALRLHVSLFAKTVTTSGKSTSQVTQIERPGGELDIESTRTQLHAVMRRSGPRTSADFERFIVDLLTKASGQIESNPRGKDDGVDAVIGLGGTDGTSLVVLVEVKKLVRSSTSLPQTAEQLLRQLVARHADLGLIIVDQAISAAARNALPPLIVALSADDLLDQLAREPLDYWLRLARNRAVHGV